MNIKCLYQIIHEANLGMLKCCVAFQIQGYIGIDEVQCIATTVFIDDESLCYENKLKL